MFALATSGKLAPHTSDADPISGCFTHFHGEFRGFRFDDPGAPAPSIFPSPDMARRLRGCEWRHECKSISDESYRLSLNIAGRARGC